MTDFLKFIISVRGGHCDCSTRGSKSLATPLLLTTELSCLLPFNGQELCSL